MTQECPDTSLPYGPRSTHRTYGHKIYEAHRVLHALNEPRDLHEPAPHKILQGPEPPKSDGRIHYRTSQWLYAVYGLEATHIWPTFGILKTLE